MFALRAVRGPSRPVRFEPRLSPRRSFAAPVSEPDPATIWHRFRTEAQRAVSETTWNIWLERLTLRELAGTTLVLEAPDDVRSWVETRAYPTSMGSTSGNSLPMVAYCFFDRAVEGRWQNDTAGGDIQDLETHRTIIC